VNGQLPSDPKKSRVYRLAGFLAVIIGVAASWAVLAEFILGIERDYWLRFPLYFLLIVIYWIPAWGAIGSRLEDVPGTKERWVQGAGCLLAALAVFLLICLLLAILFLR